MGGRRIWGGVLRFAGGAGGAGWSILQNGELNVPGRPPEHTGTKTVSHAVDAWRPDVNRKAPSCGHNDKLLGTGPGPVTVRFGI